MYSLDFKRTILRYYRFLKERVQQLAKYTNLPHSRVLPVDFSKLFEANFFKKQNFQKIFKQIFFEAKSAAARKIY